MTPNEVEEANEIGSILKDLDYAWVHGSREHTVATDAVREVIYALTRIHTQDATPEAPFDQELYEDWIADVRYGRRDLDGKKVAA